MPNTLPDRKGAEMTIEIVDLSAIQKEIYAKHDHDWHSKAYRRELAALWGFAQNDSRINDAGVIVEREDFTLYDKRPFCIEISIAATPSELWVTGVSWMAATSGHSHAPSIHSKHAFKSYDDARRGTIKTIQFDLLRLARDETRSTNERRGAERAIVHLDSYLTPQLTLFDHFQRGG